MGNKVSVAPTAITDRIDRQVGTIRFRRPLRVCHVAYTFYENDNRVIRYAETLAERGDQVEVIALRRSGQAKSGEAGGVHVRRIQRRAVTEKSALQYLIKIVWFAVKATVFITASHVRRPYDLIHVHNVPDFLVFTAFVPKLTGAHVILDIHDILPELYAGKFGSEERSAVFRWLQRVERLSCWFANHVIVANHLWHDKLTRRSVPAVKCTPIMNYPDLRLFKPEGRDTRAVDDGRFVFLYPGTLNHHQGLDIAVRAFGLASGRMPGAELHIYGEGPARPMLGQLIGDLGLAGQVRLFDRVPLNQVAAVMADADAGVVPKRADGFGNEAFSTKTLEFMACGVPVIVARTQVDAHYFDDTLVRFFTPGDEADLAAAFQDVYRRRADHGPWIDAARVFAEKHSWQARAADYLNVVEGLVSPAYCRAAVAR
jgi:glycosyltransferase involved in cell wall biosynthesis